MWDFMIETKSLFKDDTGSCTEAKFLVPEYYKTVPKKLWNSNEKILWNNANNTTLKVDFIPQIRDYEMGLCVLSARSGGWGGGAV